MCVQKGKHGDKMIRPRKAHETEENLLLVYVKKKKNFTCLGGGALIFLSFVRALN